MRKLGLELCSIAATIAFVLSVTSVFAEEGPSMEDTMDFLNLKIAPMTVTLDGEGCGGLCWDDEWPCQFRFGRGNLGEANIKVSKYGEERRERVLLSYWGTQVEGEYRSSSYEGLYLDEANTDVKLHSGFSNCETQNPVVVVKARGSRDRVDIYVNSMEEGEKIRKALIHLIKLSGGKEPLDENLFD